MKEKTALLIGDGASLDQYREYCVYNNFDYTIGTYCHFDDEDIDFTHYTLDKLDHCNFAIQYAKQYHSVTYTTGVLAEKTGVKGFDKRMYFDSLYTMQMRVAYGLGAEHIVTVAWDWQNLSPRLYESPMYRKFKPIQQHRCDSAYHIERRQKLRANLKPIYKKFTTVEHKGLLHFDAFRFNDNLVLR